MGLKDPERRRAYAAMRRARDREKIREYGAKYRERTREKEREKQRLWKANHREHRLAWEREHRRKPHVKSKKAKDKLKHRALMMEAFVEEVDREVVWARDCGVCGICGETVQGTWHLDHKIPLSKGGTHEYANVQVSHPLCNQRKSDKCA